MNFYPNPKREISGNRGYCFLKKKKRKRKIKLGFKLLLLIIFLLPKQEAVGGLKIYILSHYLF